MLCFKPFEAPHDYVFLDPDSGFKYEAASRKELIQRIVAYRSQNDLPPIEFLDMVLEDYLCNQSLNIGKCKPLQLRRGILQYAKGGLTLLKNIYYKKFVSQEIADARAEICIDCPGNDFPDKGPFLTWTDDIALHTIGSRKSIHHAKLGSCLACTCILKAKVFYADTLTLSEDEILKMRAFNPKCWQFAEYQKDLETKVA